jgi:predicted nucleic acid-binding protein
MILVDTSVWVDYLQRGNNGLAERLIGGLVCTHPYVVGELALGNLKQRATVLKALQHLPVLATATDLEVLAFIDAHTLHGTGVGYVDVHLLSAVLLTPDSMLWTLDKRLHEAATRIGMAMDALH